MPTIKVRNDKGTDYTVDTQKLSEAIKDGFLPVVSNSKGVEHRVKPEDMPLAAKDGFSVVSMDLPAKMSATDAALEGVKQGIPFSAQIGGAVDAALSKTGNLLVPEGGQNPYTNKPIDQVYAEGRDNSKADYRKAMTDHPAITTATSLASSIPLSVATGGGLGTSTALGAAYGASNQDSTSNMLKGAALGGGIGAAASQIPKLVGAAISKAQTATPAVSSAETLAQGITGLPKESLPSNLRMPERPADWFFKTKGSESIPFASSELPPIPEQAPDAFFKRAVGGTLVGNALDSVVPGAGKVLGVPMAAARTEAAQKMAQSGLSAAAPALKAIDSGVQSAATFIGGPEMWGKLSPQIQQTLQQAASQGSRQLAITHFLLQSQNPDYQKATTQNSSTETEPEPKIMSSYGGGGVRG